MIKTGALNNQSPSVLTGQRGTVIKNGEAVCPDESAPDHTEVKLASYINKDVNTKAKQLPTDLK
jgi:hypothetical protein